jgi:phosphotransferase system HPr (HPr) family protein
MVTALQKFDSEVLLRKDDQEVDGKSIMGILTLTAEYGSKLTMVAEGPDEQAVMDNMTNSLTIRNTRNSPMASSATPPETRVFKGISASPGIAIGKAFVLEDMDLAVGRWQVPPEAVKAEVSRFRGRWPTRGKK